MNLLLDTQVLLWLANDPKRLTEEAIRLIEEASDLSFSVASIWEIVFKNSLGRDDFRIAPRKFYESLLKTTIENWSSVRTMRSPYVYYLIAIEIHLIGYWLHRHKWKALH